MSTRSGRSRRLIPFPLQRASQGKSRRWSTRKGRSYALAIRLSKSIPLHIKRRSLRRKRERHDRAWWNKRYNRIVRAGTGFYVFDEGYWFPALGYDPDADIYAYEGPIYALEDMTPDQEVAAMQARLEVDGYYSGSITGVLDSVTQQAIAKFQADSGLLATGAIDQPTIEALGLA